MQNTIQIHSCAQIQLGCFHGKYFILFPEENLISSLVMIPVFPGSENCLEGLACPGRIFQVPMGLIYPEKVLVYSEKVMVKDLVKQPREPLVYWQQYGIKSYFISMQRKSHCFSTQG